MPYWALFGTCAARDTLARYLGDAEPYDEIHLGLFSHGTCSIGRAHFEDWDGVRRHARRHGAYCGVDTEAYPQDFASNGRFHRAASALPTAPRPAGRGAVGLGTGKDCAPPAAPACTTQP